MRHTKKKKLVYSLLVAAILLIIVILAWPARKLSDSNHGSVSASSDKSQAKVQTFNKQLYPTDVASSIWAVVNKGRRLPSSYVPSGLQAPPIPLRYGSSLTAMQVRSDTAQALGRMYQAGLTAGIKLMLASGYRSYDFQVSVHDGYVQSSGAQAADTYSARPGFSEHQTGLAADLGSVDGQCTLDQCFGDTPAGQWLAANCYKYGFIIRYPKDKENLTGYVYEPWHVRYVGDQLAHQLHQTGQTMEQFFGLPDYTDYPAESLTLKL